MSPKQDAISIADAVESLRNQIVEAKERGKNSADVTFELHEVEVELQMIAEQTDAVGGKAGFSLAVFTGSAGYDAEFKTSHNHTVRFKLNVGDAQRKRPGVLMNDD